MGGNRTHDLAIHEIKSLKTNDVARLILGCDPWKTLRFKMKDATAMAKMGRTRKPRQGAQRIVLGAFIGRKMVGFTILSSGFLGGWYLHNLVVSSDERNQGIGGELMDEAERLVFSKSKNFYLCVSSFNKRGGPSTARADSKKSAQSSSCSFGLMMRF